MARRRRRDDVEAAVRVERRPRRIVHRTATFGTSYRSFAICATTRFVLSPSVATSDEIRIGDARALENGDVHAVPNVERPRPFLAEALERLLGLVHGSDLPPGAVEALREGRADPAASDHDRFHGATVISSSSSRTPCGYAITMTSQGALRRT